MLSLVSKMGHLRWIKPLRGFAIAGIAGSLIGCAGAGATVATQDYNPFNNPIASSVAKQSVDAPKQQTRAMDIFFYQSRVGDAVMDKFPFLDTGDGHPDLVAAEARMMAACSHLAQAALHKVSGGEPGVRLKFMVFLTLDACEDAARNVETLLSSDTMMADSSSL